jgi:predicted RNA-binding protein with PIN domain
VSRELTDEQKIIVDGYNVIYADDALRKIALRDMERARREFLSRIESYVSNKSIHVTVVFDGRGVLAETETIIPGKLQVAYSAGRETADDVIVSMVTGSDNPRSHLVVTSDRVHIRPAVAVLGCRSIGAKAFLDRISGRGWRRKRQGGRAPGLEADEKPKPGSDDRDYWLDQFEGDGGEDT